MRRGIVLSGILLGLILGCGEDEPSRPTAIDVHVVPDAATVATGASQRFRAFVTGTTNTEVTWAVEGGVDNGTVSPRGVYWAPGTVPDLPTVTVRAISMADSAQSGSATVKIVAAGPDSTDLVRVPAGTYAMGDPRINQPEHDVTLTRDFYLGQMEVANREFMEVMQWAYDLRYVDVSDGVVYDRMDGRTGTEVPLYYLASFSSEIAFADGEFTLRHTEHGVSPDNPIQGVSWYGAAAYCDWRSLKEGLPRAYDHATWACNGGDPYDAVGYRLPTEAEWEYAAQYDDERLFPWGDEWPTCDLVNFYNYQDGTNACTGWTLPVGSLLAEKSVGGKGIYDMAGNVMEWCGDWYAEDLGFDPTQDPQGATVGVNRVVRGGSMDTLFTFMLVCAYRTHLFPSYAYYFVGFRVARTADR